MRRLLTATICLGLLAGSAEALLATNGPNLNTQKEDKTIARPGAAATVKLKDRQHGRLEKGDHVFTAKQSREFEGSYWDKWTLKADRGVNYFVSMNLPRYECVVIIADETGKVLAMKYSRMFVPDDHNQPLQYMASPWFTAPKSGTVYIYVTTKAAHRSGDYTLWVTEMD